MASDHDRSVDPLLARADRAIADAVALRATVEAGLAAAERYRPFRPWSGQWRPAPLARPAPMRDEGSGAPRRPSRPEVGTPTVR